MVPGKLDIHMQKNEIRSGEKSNYKWIKDLLWKLKPETPNLLEEKIGNILHDTGVGKGFLNRTQFVQEL